MKKYLVLLIIPLLFFSTGCDDNDDIDDTIPVSEYPESILGHWEHNTWDNITTTTTQIIQIDPVFGTETVQEFISTSNSELDWVDGDLGFDIDEEWQKTAIEVWLKNNWKYE